MKPYIRVLLIFILLITSVIPLISISSDEGVFAYSGSATHSQSCNVTDSGGVARSYVPVILTSINGTTLLTSGYINADGLNTAAYMVDTGDETPYMLDTTRTVMIIPALPAYGTKKFNFLMGTSENRTGFPMAVGTNGYITISDNTTIELSDNFTVEWSGYIDTSVAGNITSKPSAYDIQSDGSGNIKGIIYGQTYIMYPTGVGDLTDVPTANPAVAHWQNMDDPAGAPDDAATEIVSTVAALLYDTYSMDDPAINSASTINSITVVYRMKGTSQVRPALRLNGTTSSGTPHSNAAWTTYSENISRPGGGSWSVADLADLQVGVGIEADGVNPMEATQVYAIVNYDNAISLSESSGTADVILSSDGSSTTFTVGVDVDTSVASTVTDNANDIRLMSNATPYSDNFTITVDGVRKLYFAPALMPTSTNIPDRETGDGVSNDGTITWGTNSNLTISYGDIVETESVRTDDASGVQSTNAYLYGAVLSLGLSDYVNVGFQYGQDTTYGLGTTPLQQLTSASSYYYPVTGLSPNTTYHFRAVLVYGVSNYIYGEDKTFTTLPVTGSSTTIEIKTAKMFQNYITTGDLLLTVEALNTYTYLYPNQSPRTHFTIQLLATDGTTILGAAPLSNWGDRPSSIYFNATAVTANITIGTAYYVRMIGDEQSGNATTIYQLIPTTTENSDWEGSDLTNLDEWCIGTAKNMGIIDAANQDYYLVDSTDRGKVIGDNAAGYFNIGIPYIGQVRPKIFATSEYRTDIQTGTADNKWDSATAWETFVGATIAGEVTTLAIPFGVSGKDFLTGVILLVILGCVMVVVAGTGGMGALGAVLISTPILWVGTYFRILPAAIMILMVIVFGMFAIRQFVIKTL